ncbi:MAG: uncharacterized protein KVP18_004987 [Porospora cf. gigantea A]|uniref:uncharacterized protein n=1 Tax=Porospora cf. gigantea A TaxID=2853593 RepID=UPI0035594EB4|nr:MAG: hypothetical protein KVP18_004987 [Porospora cf. gigantea A]
MQLMNGVMVFQISVSLSKAPWGVDRAGNVPSSLTNDDDVRSGLRSSHQKMTGVENVVHTDERLSGVVGLHNHWRKRQQAFSKDVSDEDYEVDISDLSAGEPPVEPEGQDWTSYPSDEESFEENDWVMDISAQSDLEWTEAVDEAERATTSRDEYERVEKNTFDVPDDPPSNEHSAVLFDNYCDDIVWAAENPAAVCQAAMAAHASLCPGENASCTARTLNPFRQTLKAAPPADDLGLAEVLAILGATSSEFLNFWSVNCRCADGTTPVERIISRSYVKSYGILDALGVAGKLVDDTRRAWAARSRAMMALFNNKANKVPGRSSMLATWELQTTDKQLDPKLLTMLKEAPQEEKHWLHQIYPPWFVDSRSRV